MFYFISIVFTEIMYSFVKIYSLDRSNAHQQLHEYREAYKWFIFGVILSSHGKDVFLTFLDDKMHRG